MAEPITNTQDVIDSRDVIERIKDIESLFDGDVPALAEYEPDELDLTAEVEEYAALQALANEAENYAPDWMYGEALIRDSYFVEYAQQLADDVGAIDLNASWPMSCIDWDKAARELQMDYTPIDFDGVTYWIR